MAFQKSCSPRSFGSFNSTGDKHDVKSEVSQNFEQLTKRQKLQKWNSASQSGSDDYPRWRLFLLWLIRTWAFETVVGFLVVFNLGISWYQTDATAAPKSQADLPPWIEKTNLLLFALYLIETLLRILAFQGKFFEGWFNWDTFDLFLVCSDLVPLTVSLFTQVDQNPAIRALRMCRALRMIKAIRVWPAFRELYVMMHGFLGAMKAMLWSTVLLGLLLTLFGIIAVEVLNPLTLEIHAQGGFGDCVRCYRAFATVGDSMTTFFQQVVAGDSWGEVTIPVIEANPWTAIIFISVVVTVQFGILNLILVAIVAQATKASTDDAMFQAMTRKEEFETARKELLDVCADLDTDKSGEISLRELIVGYDNLPELANQLRFLDVKKDDMSILFNTLDHDGSGQVNYEEFVEQLFGMQNSDTGVLLALLRTYIQDLRKSACAQGEAIAQLQKTLQVLVPTDKQVLLPGKQGGSFNSLSERTAPQLGKLVQRPQSSDMFSVATQPKECCSSIQKALGSMEDVLGVEMQQIKERLQEKAVVDTGMALKVKMQQAAKQSLDALENYHCQALTLLQQNFAQNGLTIEKSALHARRTSDNRKPLSTPEAPGVSTDLRASGYTITDSLALQPVDSEAPLSGTGANLLSHLRLQSDHLHPDSMVCTDSSAEGPVASACECWPSSRPYDPTKE